MLISDMLADASRLQIEGFNEKNREKVEESQRTLLSLINSAPDDPHVLFLLGTSYLLQGYNGLAISLLRRAACFEPVNPVVHCNLASAYKGEDMNFDAERHLIIANALREDTQYMGNLAALWVNRGHPERGIPWGERALELNSTNAKAAWNLGLLYLENGQFDEGFKLYLAGIDSGDRLVKHYESGGERVPMWKGEPGKNVVVYGEQGLGDEILFASAIEDLANDCESLVIDCHPRLEGVFRRSFPDARAVYGCRKDSDTEWAKEYALDAMVPMGNLFYHYRRDRPFPRKAYLTPDPEKMAKYRDILEDMGPPPYIGFSWEGGSKATHASFRSAKLGHFRDMFSLPATFVSLQYTDVQGKIDRFNQPKKLLHSFPDAVKAFDYDETIALVGALDLVVTVCTSVAHVCGAIGTNCIVMTPFQRAWRYGPDNTMYQYGDWIWQAHKGEDEPWDEYAPRLTEEVERWIASK